MDPISEKNFFEESILTSLRRIVRAIDLHSRDLGSRYKLTVPQLVCLRQLRGNGSCTPSELARHIFLSQATVTGILDRLEARGLVERVRQLTDRRRISICLTEKGEELTASAPSPLQDRFSENLADLTDEEQSRIDQNLKTVVEMMEAQKLDAAPIMAPAGPLGVETGLAMDNGVVGPTTATKN